MKGFLDGVGLKRLVDNFLMKLSEKQDKLTGTAGQVVGFNAAGKPVAQGTESLVGPPGADGAPGTNGKSAYQYAVEGGYTGTEAEFRMLMGSGPWLPTTGGTVIGETSIFGKFQATGDVIFAGMVRTEKDKHTLTFLPAATSLKFGTVLLFANSIDLHDTDTGAPIEVYGVKTPVFQEDAANKQYVDDAVASLKQYVDDAIASIGPTAPSWAFAFSVSDSGYLICSYTGGTPPEFQISDDGHLIYSYAGGEPPAYYINENGHLCLDIEEGT